MQSFQQQARQRASSQSDLQQSPQRQPKNGGYRPSPANRSLSPAEAALAASHQTDDSFEISQAASSNAFADESFAPPHGTSNDSTPHDADPESSSIWKSIPTEDLNALLNDERSLVVAVVLSQVPADVARSIVKNLPRQLTVDALQQLPSLSEIDEEILTEIHEHLQQRLVEYRRPQKARAANQQRLALLLGELDEPTRQACQQLLPNHATPRYRQPSEANPPSTDQSLHANAPTEKHLDSNTPEADADILPFRAASAHSVTQRPAADTTEPIKTPEKSKTPNSGYRLDMSDLEQLSAEELLLVFKSTSAETVLLALSGATEAFYARFVGFLHPRDAQQLRARLLSLGPLNLSQVDEAQSDLCRAAGDLMAAGKIGSLFNVSFLAAA
jgi:hypothetical protein